MRWFFAIIICFNYDPLVALQNETRVRNAFCPAGKQKKTTKVRLACSPGADTRGLWYSTGHCLLAFCGRVRMPVVCGAVDGSYRTSPRILPRSVRGGPFWGSFATLIRFDRRAQVPAWHYIFTYLFCTTASNEKHTKSGSIPMWPEIPQRDTAVAHPSRRLDCATWASGIFHGAARRVSGKQWQRYHLYTLHRKRQWGNWDGSRRGKHWGWDAKFSTHTTQESLGTPQ